MTITMNTISISTLRLTAILLLLVSLKGSPVQAVDTNRPLDQLTIQVDTFEDEDNDRLRACTLLPRDCSLRGAVMHANLDPNTLYTIQVPAGRFLLRWVHFEIHASMIIQGAGRSATIIDGQNNDLSPIFFVFPETQVEFRDVQITHGKNLARWFGGAIMNQGDLLLTSCALLGNSAAVGAGVFNSGRLGMTNCLVGENTSRGSGAGIFNEGEMSVSFSDIFSNTISTAARNSPGYPGGGIYNRGILQIEYTHIRANMAGRAGNDGYPGKSGGDGGGVYNSGKMQILNSFVQGNLAGTGGDGVNSAPEWCNAPWEGGVGGNGGGIYNSGDLALVDSLVGDNFAGAGGVGGSNAPDGYGYCGGFPKPGGSGGHGGGIYNQSNLAIQHSQIQRNQAGSGGRGGDFKGCIPYAGAPGGDGGYGGGIYSITDMPFQVDASALLRNRAGNYGPDGSMGGCNLEEFTLPGYTEYPTRRERDNQAPMTKYNGSGGGIYQTGGPAVITNSVIAYNSAGENGSGLLIAGAHSQLLHVTIASNRGGDGSGIYLAAQLVSTNTITSTLFITNTILVSQTVGIDVTEGNLARFEGMLWGDGTWDNEQDWRGDGVILPGQVNLWGDPLLQNPEMDDFHLQPSSPAIDQGAPSDVLWDIDGDPRPNGSKNDLGADEYYIRIIYFPFITTRSIFMR